MLKALVGSGLRAGLKSWPTVLFFEIIYKITGYILFLNLWDLLRTAALWALGVSVIGQQNIGLILYNPFCVMLIVCVLLLLAYYIYLEITTLVLYCEEGGRAAQ